MSDNVETMAYTNEVPWHGLGERVDNKRTVPQMLKAAGIDWTVSKRPLYTRVETNSPNSIIDDYTQISEAYALMRDSDEKVLDVVGRAYVPHQNHENFEFFKEYVEAGDAYMETAGSLQGGRIVWGLANLNSSFFLKGKDEVKGYLLVIAPHQQGKASIAKLTTVRVVCNNTLNLALGEKGQEFRMPHRKQMTKEVIQEAKVKLGIARETFQDFKSTATNLQKMKLTEKEKISFLAPIFQPDIGIKELTNDFENTANTRMRLLMDISQRAPGAQPDNAWGLLNAVTYYSDHVASRTSDKRMTNSWLGKTAAQKQRILEALVKA